MVATGRRSDLRPVCHHAVQPVRNPVGEPVTAGDTQVTGEDHQLRVEQGHRDHDRLRDPGGEGGQEPVRITGHL
jgi:hypothetical protein